MSLALVVDSCIIFKCLVYVEMFYELYFVLNHMLKPYDKSPTYFIVDRYFTCFQVMMLKMIVWICKLRMTWA
jgi:hypothetical protein